MLGCVIIYAAAVPLVGGHNAMLISEIVTVAGRLPTMAVLMGGVFIIIGFGSKAGFVPFHAWLPDAHSQSPSPVSALLSGVTIKVAIYAIARIATVFFPGHSALGTFAVVLGAITMLAGILIAYQQTDLKRMLAYSSVSQMGYIILGLGIGSFLEASMVRCIICSIMPSIRDALPVQRSSALFLRHHGYAAAWD